MGAPSAKGQIGRVNAAFRRRLRGRLGWTSINHCSCNAVSPIDHREPFGKFNDYQCLNGTRGRHASRVHQIDAATLALADRVVRDPKIPLPAAYSPVLCFEGQFCRVQVGLKRGYIYIVCGVVDITHVVLEFVPLPCRERLQLFDSLLRGYRQRDRAGRHDLTG